MKKNMDTRGSVLLDLFNNKLLCSKVDSALDRKVPYEEIIEMAKENYDFSISKASLSRYKQKREEAQLTGTPLEELIDQRAKNGNVIDIRDKRDVYATSTPDKQRTWEDFNKETDKVYSSLQVLDEMIQKGVEGLKYVDTLEPNILLKTIEMRNKIDGGDSGGLTLLGIKQLALQYQARESALTNLVLSYIPEDKHEEVAEALENFEQEFYANLDLTEEEKRINEAINMSGLME